MKEIMILAVIALVLGAPALGFYWAALGHWGLGLGVASIGPVSAFAFLSGVAPVGER